MTGFVFIPPNHVPVCGHTHVCVCFITGCRTFYFGSQMIVRFIVLFSWKKISTKMMLPNSRLSLPMSGILELSCNHATVELSFGWTCWHQVISWCLVVPPALGSVSAAETNLFTCGGAFIHGWLFVEYICCFFSSFLLLWSLTADSLMLFPLPFLPTVVPLPLLCCVMEVGSAATVD